MLKKQDFNPSIMVITLLTILVLLFFSHSILLAQELKFEIKTKPAVTAPENAIQHTLIQSADTNLLVHTLRIKDSLILLLPDKEPVIFPYRLQQLVSYDGSTIIQYGDKRMIDLPTHLDVHWIDQDGKEINSLINYFKGDARLIMSTDGYVAVGGSVFDTELRVAVGCYTPDGNSIWETDVPQNRRINKLYAASLGKSVIAITSHFEKWLEDHQFNIYNEIGVLQSIVRNLGILQHVVLLGDESKFFFQGRDYYGMIEIATGTVLWKKAGKVTMISPEAAALSPDGRYLYLVDAQIKGLRTGNYGWKLMLLDPYSGDEVSSFVLPEKYPANRNRIFKSVSNNGVILWAGESNITITLKN